MLFPLLDLGQTLFCQGLYPAPGSGKMEISWAGLTGDVSVGPVELQSPEVRVEEGLVQ